MGGAISQNDITEDELLNSSQIPQTQTPISGTQQTQTRQIVTPTSNNPPVQQKSNTAVHLNTTPQPPQNPIPLQVPTTPVPQTKNAPSKIVIQPPNAIVHKHLLDAVVAGNLQQLNLCLQNGGSVLVTDKVSERITLTNRRVTHRYIMHAVKDLLKLCKRLYNVEHSWRERTQWYFVFHTTHII
jgi:hypothetical protein